MPDLEHRKAPKRALLFLLLAVCSPAQTIITTLAGSRAASIPDAIPALNAPVGGVSGVTQDAQGNTYFSDLATDRVYRIDAQGILSGYAGSGTHGYSGDGGPAGAAALSNPRTLVFDAAGNLYISDSGNSRVRKVTNGIISTVAGNGLPGFAGDGGPATYASFGTAARIALDSNGNIYISDPDNHRIRRVTADGLIHTFAGNGVDAFAGDGGPALQASLQTPAGLAFDSTGNLYIADSESNRVRRITPGGVISTVAGNGISAEGGDGGSAIQARLNGPAGVTIDPNSALLIADQSGSRIRRVDPNTGFITTLAGTSQLGFGGDGGPAAAASLYSPVDLFASGQSILVADLGNFRVRLLAAGTLSTIAGNGNYRYTGDGGIAGNAGLPSPDGLAIGPNGNVYICDNFANRVRAVSSFGIISLIAGVNAPGFSGDGGPATSAALVDCDGIAVDPAGNLYIADTHNRRIRKVSTSGNITTFAGTGANSFAGDGGPAINASLSNPQGVALDSRGNVFVADTGNNRIRQISPSGTITTVAGTGSAGYSGDGISSTAAQLNAPSRLAVDSSGNIFFTDNGNNVVRRINPAGFIATVAGNGQYGFAGDGAPATSAMLANPIGLAIDASGGILIADSDNQRIRRVDPTGVITTIAGNGTSTLSGDGRSPLLTGFGSPIDVAADANGNIYIADQNDGRVRRIQPTPSSLVLSETGITFTAAVDAAAISSRTVRILNGGSGSIGWSAVTSVLSGGSNWLSVSPTQGSSTSNSTTSPVIVSVNPGGLASGAYYGQIEIASPGVSNSPRFVTVVLNILAASQTAGPSVTPAAVLFTALAGGPNPPSQTLTVSTLHGGSVSFTASLTFPDSSQWLTISPASGALSPAKPATITLQATAAGLPSRVYTATLSLTFSGGATRSVPATFTVSSPSITSSSKRFGTASSAAVTCLPTQLLPAVTVLGQSFSVPAGWPAPIEATIVDDCGQPFTAGSVIATFTNGDPPLALSGFQDGTWAATWSPRSAANLSITVTAQSAAISGLAPIRGSVQIGGQISPNTSPPIVNTGGILNAASFAAGVPPAPGSLISIFGANLAAKAASATALPLPTQLAGSQVIIGGVPMPLLYAGPGQINAVVPFTTGVNTTQQVIVVNGSTLSVPEPAIIAPGSPAAFTLNGSGAGAAIVAAVNPDGSSYLVSTTRPAHPGSVIVIYCTGLGGVQSTISAGDAAPLAPLAPATDLVSLNIGGNPATVLFAGLVPTLSGLYQINAQIPSETPTGDAVPLLVSAVGIAGTPVTIAIH